MSENVNVVLVHGAWADGSSWAKVIGPLAAEGIRVLAAPLPLTSFTEDTAAVERTLERVSGLVVLAGHAYAGAAIAATQNEKVKALIPPPPTFFRLQPSSIHAIGSAIVTRFFGIEILRDWRDDAPQVSGE
jgi:pimeloyl-ACP methyl ester carboxylesterase